MHECRGEGVSPPFPGFGRAARPIGRRELGACEPRLRPRSWEPGRAAQPKGASPNGRALEARVPRASAPRASQARGLRAAAAWGFCAAAGAPSKGDPAEEGVPLSSRKDQPKGAS